MKSPRTLHAGAAAGRRGQGSERELQEQGRQFMALEGWRLVVTDPAHLRGLGVTEPGIPDDLHIRYADVRHGGKPTELWARVVWIEWKKKGGKTGIEQERWHQFERLKGGQIWLAGVDFEAELGAFIEFYMQTGVALHRWTVDEFRSRMR